MRTLCFFAALLMSFPHSLAAQQATSSPRASSPQAISLLTQSVAALTGTATVSDVTLSGAARRIAGADDESGSVTVKALARAGIRIDLSLPSGSRSELRDTSTAEPVGSWSGADGVQHAISNHNLITDPGWFPPFALSNLLSAPNAIITYVGPETHDGQAVIHITASQQFPALSGNIALLMQHLTQTEIFLDPSTNLPVAFAFNTHPDNDAGVDIPVEILFSDYRSMNGAQISFHVEKFLNNSLLLDLQFQSVTLNSGLSASLFTGQ